MNKTIKIIFLLTVYALLFAGCGKQEVETTTDRENTTQESDTSKNIWNEEIKEEFEREKETKPEEESEFVVEESSNPQMETSYGNPPMPQEDAEQKESSAQTQESEQKVTDSTTQEITQQVQPQPQPEQEEVAQPEPQSAEPEKMEPVLYSPQRVVELAVEKTAAQGKIYIPDDLNRMLETGEISQEDYDACYPTDGAGYLEYYVAADMNEARDISGTIQFTSEADIAANIAGMYAALPQQYFYIEYGGIVVYGGKECYVFYCYRA